MRADTKRVEEDGEENQPHQISLRAPFFSFSFTLRIGKQDNCLENLYTRFIFYTCHTSLYNTTFTNHSLYCYRKKWWLRQRNYEARGGMSLMWLEHMAEMS